MNKAFLAFMIVVTLGTAAMACSQHISTWVCDDPVWRCGKYSGD